MVIAVPLAIGVALATTVFLPRRLRGPIAVGGRPAGGRARRWSTASGASSCSCPRPGRRSSGSREHSGRPRLLRRPGHLGARTSSPASCSGVMVLPIVAAITREVLATVPREQQEAAYALGATRWEMVRSAMLPWARSGIVGASALGLGRAVGETIAIALLLGNSPNIFGSLLGPGRDAGERHRARVRRGQQPPALGADRPGRGPLRALVHHQRARPAAGGPHRGRAGAAPARPGRRPAGPATAGRASEGRARGGRRAARRGGALAPRQGSGRRGAADRLARPPRPLGHRRGRGVRRPGRSR